MDINKRILKFQKRLRKMLKKAQTSKLGEPASECKFITNQIHINSFVWYSEKGRVFEVRGWVNDAYGKKNQDVEWRCFYADSFILDEGTIKDLVALLPGELLKSLAKTAYHSKSKTPEIC